MEPYNHVCESCGHEWEQGHQNDKEAEAEKCPNCESEETQANRANH